MHKLWKSVHMWQKYGIFSIQQAAILDLSNMAARGGVSKCFHQFFNSSWSKVFVDKHPQILSGSALLWGFCALRALTTTVLINTLIYLIGLNFVFRAAQDHRNLCGDNSQLELLADSDGVKFLQYTEDVSKSNRGGLRHRKVTPKSVRAYPNSENKERCIVALYELYCSIIYVFYRILLTLGMALTNDSLSEYKAFWWGHPLQYTSYTDGR